MLFQSWPGSILDSRPFTSIVPSGILESAQATEQLPPALCYTICVFGIQGAVVEKHIAGDRIVE